MYKVFFNERFVLLTDNISSKTFSGNTLCVEYWNKSSINFLIEKFENTRTIDKLIIHYHDLNELWFVFKSCFYNIEAAGGLVKNQHNEVLLIKRNNVWDLPKGKIEKNETSKIGAIREVEEECGITGLEIISTLTPSFHTYAMNNEKVLKKTHWFEMKYSGGENTIPQSEEGITDAVWVKQEDVPNYFDNMYKSIIEVLKEGLKLK